MNWNKGFNVANVVGKDVVKLLQDALNRKRLPVQCDALVNDVRDTENVFPLFHHSSPILTDYRDGAGTLLYSWELLSRYVFHHISFLLDPTR